jgi:protein SCO1/2
VALIAICAVAVLAIGLVAARLNRHEATWAGTVLPATQPKPDFTLTDTSGKPFDFRAGTEGRFTVLFFGYTHCPDVCPINLATLDAAMETLGPEVRGKIDVVFVTTDPARDTPPVMRQFLDRFDTGFVGLTGTPQQLADAQAAAKVPIAEVGKKDSTGDYTVGHATQMILYGPDDLARIVYPSGIRQSDWTRDLPRLLAGEEPST